MESVDAATVPPLIAAVFAVDVNHDTEAFLDLLTPDRISLDRSLIG